jgi:hypothetical protein
MSAIADRAPSDDAITEYDRRHLVAYIRLLDAEAAGADWCEAAKIVLDLDPQADPEHARAAWESHLARARWMTTSGYAHLMGDAEPHPN